MSGKDKLKWEALPLPYFTELCLIHGWPHPDWLPSDDWGKNSAAASQLASEQRSLQVERGNLGTIVGLSDKSDARLLAVPSAPGWMK